MSEHDQLNSQILSVLNDANEWFTASEIVTLVNNAFGTEYTVNTVTGRLVALYNNGDIERALDGPKRRNGTTTSNYRALQPKSDIVEEAIQGLERVFESVPCIDEPVRLDLVYLADAFDAMTALTADEQCGVMFSQGVATVLANGAKYYAKTGRDLQSIVDALLTLKGYAHE